MSTKHNTSNFAIVLDKNGGIKENITIDNISNISDEPVWIHLDFKGEKTFNLLTKKLKINKSITEILCAEDVRQKSFTSYNPAGTFVILREATSIKIRKPDDMLSLRIWIEGNKIITLSHQKSPAITSTFDNLNNNSGPKSIIECFASITHYTFHSLSDITYDMIDDFDVLEEKIIENGFRNNFNDELSLMRRQIVTIHRYLIPQKELFKNLPNDNPMFVENNYKHIFDDLYNDISKSIENLEYCRENVIIIKEEIDSSIDVSTNNSMYVLSIIIAIFTPLTLISGMLGMNLSGIPYSEHKYSFGIVCLAILSIAVLSFLIMKRKKLI